MGVVMKCGGCGGGCCQRHRESPKERTGFGAKSIGFWGSFCLILNNAMGAGMLVFPLVMQEAGLTMPLLALLLVYLVSTLSCTMLCDAIQRMPGNRNFTLRVEYGTVVKYYLGKSGDVVGQILFNVSNQTQNLIAMIVSVQVVDNFLMKIAGKSWALDYTSFHVVTTNATNHEDPWDGQLTIVSLGFLVSVVICIPFGYINLDENMWFQWFSLVGLLGFTAVFFVQWIINSNEPGLGPSLTPGFTSTEGQLHVLGTIVFAYAFVITIPSWLNEMHPTVNVNRAVWVPATVSLAMKICAGLLGAWAYVLISDDAHPTQHCPEKPSHTDQCSVVTGASNILNLLARYVSYLWNITTIIPGIPVLSVILRYNFLASGVWGGKTMAFVWAVLLPWLVCMFTYRLEVLADICTWGGIVFMGFANFVLPVWVYRAAALRHPYPHERHYHVGQKGFSQLPGGPLCDLAGGGSGSGDVEQASGIGGLAVEGGAAGLPGNGGASSSGLDSGGKRSSGGVGTGDGDSVGGDSRAGRPRPGLVGDQFPATLYTPAAAGEDRGDHLPTPAEPAAPADLVNALPAWTRLEPVATSTAIAALFTALSLAIISLNIYTVAAGRKVL